MRAAEAAGHHQRLQREAFAEVHRLRIWRAAAEQEPKQEVGLIEEPERDEAFVLGGGADAREVDVCREVLLARAARATAACPLGVSGPAIVCRENVVSVPPACVAEYSSRASWP